MFDTSEVFAPSDVQLPETPAAAPAAAADPGQPVAPQSGAPPAPVPGMAAPAAGEDWEIPGVGRVSREELIKGYLRQQDYSRKTQALSQLEREHGQFRSQNQQYEQALAQVHAFLSDRAKIEKYLAGLPGGQPQAPQLAPDQILTAAEAQALMQRQIGETQLEFQRRLQEFQQQTLEATYRTQYEQAIDNKLRDIQGRHPELAKIPGMEMLLRNAVSTQTPRSIDDALQLFDQAAVFYSGRFKELGKSALPPANNPNNRGVLPPTTAAPVTSPEATEFSGVKDPNLRNQVIRDLEAILARAPGQ